MNSPAKFQPTHRLFCPSLNSYVGNCDASGRNPLVKRDAAMQLDIRDNEQLKARFFSALIGAAVVPERIS